MRSKNNNNSEINTVNGEMREENWSRWTKNLFSLDETFSHSKTLAPVILKVREKKTTTITEINEVSGEIKEGNWSPWTPNLFPLSQTFNNNKTLALDTFKWDEGK